MESDSKSKHQMPPPDLWNLFKSRAAYIKNQLLSRLPRSNPENLSSQPEVIEKDIVVIGAGISGLACFKTLYENISSSLDRKEDILLLEQSFRPGGRVFSEEVEGFILDYGFQVFIDSYPQSRKIFDYPALVLNKFLPGALVYSRKQFYPVFDPFRLPRKLLQSLRSPIGSPLDKLLVVSFSSHWEDLTHSI